MVLSFWVIAALGIAALWLIGEFVMFTLLLSFIMAIAIVGGIFWFFNLPITSSGVKARDWMQPYINKVKAWKQ